MHVSEPTGGQCGSNELIFQDEKEAHYAIWYPQMGGYVGRAVAVIEKGPWGAEACIDVYVWHDGDFPFHDGEPPRRIHHCNPNQFIDFGKTLVELNKGVAWPA